MGNYYAHEEDQEDVQCIDCHFTGKPLTVGTADLDDESAIIASLRFGNINDKQFLKTHKHGHALINTFFENDSAYFLTKNTAKKMVMKPPASVCTPR